MSDPRLDDLREKQARIMSGAIPPTTRTATLTDRDREAVEAFQNFLSWGEVPALPSTARVKRTQRSVPPAWWAYSFGDTRWCPPKGEM